MGSDKLNNVLMEIKLSLPYPKSWPTRVFKKTFPKGLKKFTWNSKKNVSVNFSGVVRRKKTQDLGQAKF